MKNLKQVIVMRNDLNMRKGKMVAQGAHAALAFARNRLCGLKQYTQTETDMQDEWLMTGQRKICVQGNSKEHLYQLQQEAEHAGLPAEIIIDSGHTEFNGEPTETCLAIGPWDGEAIDKITGNLKLY